MIDLSNVTLISVTSVQLDQTVAALLRSSKHINYGAIKLVSHQKPSTLPHNIEFYKTSKINSTDEYSFKIIYELEKYIDTDYALIVQADGFVLNPSAWRREFFDYDYIGAPFALPALHDTISYRDAKGNIFRVGNGGFSLRSKKLITLANKLNLAWKPFHGYYNEDGFICGMYRDIYESSGMRFAPLDVAKYFSHEKHIPETEGIVPFGFHGAELLNKITRNE